MKLKKEIVTKLVGLQYNAGPAPAGATVELIREYDFPNHIVAYSDNDLQIGSVIHTRYDADIVDGVPNNYKEVMKNLINLYNKHAAMHDEKACEGLAILIRKNEEKIQRKQ